MAELIRNNVVIANTADKWDNIRKKPKINEAMVESDNTSISLNVIWRGTSAEYQALPLKHPDTFYIITDSELPSSEKNYLLHDNKPKINGIELNDNIELDDLELYSRDQIDSFIRQTGAILVVSEETWEQIQLDPTIAKSNTIYYVETDTEGAYRTYMVDANFVIKFLGENSAFFVDYQKCKPMIKNGYVVKPEIKSGDNTVIGAANTIGNIEDLETSDKSSVVSAINNLQKTKLGTEYVDIKQSNFGYWNSDTKTHQYKLATVQFTEPYSYFTGTFKFLSTYKNFMLSGTEIEFSFRSEGTSSNNISMYELKSFNVPDSMKEDQATIFVYYSKQSSWPQDVEIWLQTKGASWQEFSGEWKIKNKFNYPLGTYEVFENPIDDQSFAHLTGGVYRLDLGKQKNNMMVLEGEMDVLSHVTITRDQIKTLSQGRPEYAISSAQFFEDEAPGGNLNDYYNIHILNSGKNPTIFATNIDTNYAYRSTWNGENWSAWRRVYGIDGEVGELTNLTTAPKMDYGDGKVNTVKNMSFSYTCIDMGDYYINELRIRYESNKTDYGQSIMKDYKGIDVKLMSFPSIKGKPIIDNGYYATSFVGSDYGKARYAFSYEIKGGVVYITKDKLIMCGPRWTRSNDGSDAICIATWYYTDDVQAPQIVEFNFLTRK